MVSFRMWLLGQSYRDDGVGDLSRFCVRFKPKWDDGVHRDLIHKAIIDARPIGKKDGYGDWQEIVNDFGRSWHEWKTHLNWVD